MVTSSLPLLHTLYAVAAKYGKSYCTPSQPALLELLKKHHGIGISRRTLNRWLASLEGEYIYRTRRHVRGKDGRIHFQSTLYRFSKKALRLLRKIAYPLRNLLNFSVCHPWHNNCSSKKQFNKNAPLPSRREGRQETPEENRRRYEAVMAYYHSKV